MTGSLQKKNNTYYAVIRVLDGTGKTKQKWVNTGVAVTGNTKREANRRLFEILVELEAEMQKPNPFCDILFMDWLETWLEQKKNEVRLCTWETYRRHSDQHVIPYFTPLKLKLTEVSPQHIQGFYNQKIKEGLSPSSVKCYSKVLHGALREAYRKELIHGNPADRATRPAMQRFEGKAYTPEQAQKLLDVVTGKSLEAVVKLALFYGLRRSEAIGLRWRDVNFEENTIRICNTIVQQKSIVEQELTKSKASRRTLHLPAEMKTYLQGLKRAQDERRRIMGSAYHSGDYVCAQEDGTPYRPSYVTIRFKEILQQNKLPHIRFHDLRHTAGTILMERGMMAMQISKFLGHEKVATTLDIYGHLSLEGKKETAETMGNILKLNSG